MFATIVVLWLIGIPATAWLFFFEDGGMAGDRLSEKAIVICLSLIWPITAYATLLWIAASGAYKRWLAPRQGVRRG